MALKITTLIKVLTITLFLAIASETSAQTSFDYDPDFKTILSRTKDKKDVLFYDKLVKRYSANDSSLTNFEVLALLIGFTEKPEYKPYKDLNVEREIYDLNEKQLYQKALDRGLKFLKTHPLNLKTLFEASYACEKLNRKDSADLYTRKAWRILDAMYFSGVGKAGKVPMFALGPDDGQEFIYKFFHAGIGTMGSGKDENGNFLDILEVKFKNGKTLSVSFIIQHATKKMIEK